MALFQSTRDRRFVMCADAHDYVLNRRNIISYTIDMKDMVSRQTFFNLLEQEGRLEEMAEFRKVEKDYRNAGFTPWEPDLC